METKNNRFFLKKKLGFLLFLLLLVGLYLGSAFVTSFRWEEGVSAFPQAFVWMAQNLVPDAQALERMPKIMERLLETILLSVAVTVLAAVVAFIVSLFGSKVTGFHGWLNSIVRMIAAFFRNVPDVVWAMLLLFSFGQNILTGFLALFFTTFGLLTRAFIETIDEVSASCIEALTSCGAKFSHMVCQGIVPSALTGIVTWMLYMVETNIRSSTLIGMLTATGIGYLFNMYYKRLEFGSASVVVLSIVVVVLVIENISNLLRKVIA